MLIFGAAVLLYAMILSSGNHNLLPMKIQPSLRNDDKKGQTKHIAAVTAVVAIPVILGGLAGLFMGNTACLIAMGISTVLLIIIAVIRHKNKPDIDESDITEPEDNDQK